MSMNPLLGFRWLIDTLTGGDGDVERENEVDSSDNPSEASHLDFGSCNSSHSTDSMRSYDPSTDDD